MNQQAPEEEQYEEAQTREMTDKERQLQSVMRSFMNQGDELEAEKQRNTSLQGEVDQLRSLLISRDEIIRLHLGTIDTLTAKFDRASWVNARMMSRIDGWKGDIKEMEGEMHAEGIQRARNLNDRIPIRNGDLPTSILERMEAELGNRPDLKNDPLAMLAEELLNEKGHMSIRRATPSSPPGIKHLRVRR